MSNLGVMELTRQGFAIPGFLCMAIFGLGLVIVVVLILKAILGGQQSGPFSGNRNVPGGYPQPQVGEDGFWLDTSNIPPGSKVRYRYYANGQEFDDTILTQPGMRQYVYTGGLPTNIAVLETILLGASTLHPPTITPAVPHQMHDQPPPPMPPTAPSKFAGFPAAY